MNRSKSQPESMRDDNQETTDFRSVERKSRRGNSGNRKSGKKQPVATVQKQDRHQADNHESNPSGHGTTAEHEIARGIQCSDRKKGNESDLKDFRLEGGVRFASHGYLILLAGLPPQVSPAGTSQITTEPAPTMASSPIVTPLQTMAFTPMTTKKNVQRRHILTSASQ